MPITRTAKKALRQSERKRVFNLRRLRAFRDMRIAIRKLVDAGKQTEAAVLLPKLYKAIDKAAKAHTIKTNRARRLKSRITKSVNRVAQS